MCLSAGNKVALDDERGPFCLVGSEQRQQGSKCGVIPQNQSSFNSDAKKTSGRTTLFTDFLYVIVTALFGVLGGYWSRGYDERGPMPLLSRSW